jgi:hypothetical protein
MLIVATSSNTHHFCNVAHRLSTYMMSSHGVVEEGGKRVYKTSY